MRDLALALEIWSFVALLVNALRRGVVNLVDGFVVDEQRKPVADAEIRWQLARHPLEKWNAADQGSFAFEHR